MKSRQLIDVYKRQLVDIGGGHTDISVYKNNIIEFYTTLPVGGDHITNDIAMTLDITCLLYTSRCV